MFDVYAIGNAAQKAGCRAQITLTWSAPGDLVLHHGRRDLRQAHAAAKTIPGVHITETLRAPSGHVMSVGWVLDTGEG